MLALLFILFVCSASSFANSLSSHDPFRAFSLQASRHPRFPVCCLKPLSPHDPVEDHILLSFEEWKAKQQEHEEQHKAKEHVIGHPHSVDANNSGQDIVAFSDDSQPRKGDSSTTADNSTMRAGSPQPILLDDPPSKPTQPHFRVPITDRFNYASIDCSARVHTAHRSAKSPSAVLDHKKDKYMLSPCKQAKGLRHFIVVELCDDIRIDTVQMANFEFFSGVFKDFSIRVAKTYTTDEEGWVDAGTYHAKNVRGVQSFHTPTSLRDFYRFIRIEFQSYYGNEYYCPLSLLRVYGLTHLEEYKWERWEEESKARLESQNTVLDNGLVASPVAAELPNDSSTISTSTTVAYQLPAAATAEGLIQSANNTQARMPEKSAIKSKTTQPVLTAISDTGSDIPFLALNLKSQLTCAAVDAPGYFDTPSTHTPSPTMIYSSQIISETIASLQRSIPNSAAAAPPPPSHLTTHHHGVQPSSTKTSSTHSSPSSMPPASGESIYRTIMNRLAALEINHTLYARYIEQQNIAVRDALKRLSEDVGRLEGIGRAHAQAHQKAVQEWERQRQQLQTEYKELSALVEYLYDEITLEKRLGIAQLCLLLLVLVFIALTRGSRGEPLVGYRPFRGMSLSTDWTKHVRSVSLTMEGHANVRPSTDSAPSHALQNGKQGIKHDGDLDPETVLGDGFVFPQKRSLSSVDLNVPTSSTASPTHRQPNARKWKLSDPERSRTPSFRRTAKRNLPHPLYLSPTGRIVTSSKSAAHRTPLQRSNSHSAEVHERGGLWTSRSGRRSAKSAHLHQVIRTAPIPREQEGMGTSMRPATDDVFGGPPLLHRPLTSSGVGLGLFTNHQRNKRSKRHASRADGGTEILVDVCSDSDQSGWADSDSVTEIFD